MLSLRRALHVLVWGSAGCWPGRGLGARGDGWALRLHENVVFLGFRVMMPVTQGEFYDESAAQRVQSAWQALGVSWQEISFLLDLFPFRVFGTNFSVLSFQPQTEVSLLYVNQQTAVRVEIAHVLEAPVTQLCGRVGVSSEKPSGSPTDPFLPGVTGRPGKLLVHPLPFLAVRSHALTPGQTCLLTSFVHPGSLLRLQVWPPLRRAPGV